MFTGNSQSTCEYVEGRILGAGPLHNQLDVLLDGAGKVQADRQLGVLVDGAGRRLHGRVRQLEILSWQIMKWIRQNTLLILACVWILNSENSRI